MKYLLSVIGGAPTPATVHRFCQWMTNCTRQLGTLFIEIVSGSQTKFSQGMVLARQAIASEMPVMDNTHIFLVSNFLPA
ncbi:MAG: hypothetical protein A2V87_04070 [Deltaproteobacteria bacterium RBG_16_58_17]|nr:MAG: hypothetical protein A2V87_04070 [Deltaproteobacteria bacterium RBG_16_58_17]